jgi:hypothetical protein
MAASAGEILAYLTDIKYAQSIYMDKVTRSEFLGDDDIFKLNLRNTILSYYVEIMVGYFAQSAYDSNNFFTTVEAQDVINRINRLCDSNYTIQL